MIADRFILDRASVRAVDRAAVQEYGVPSIVLMENAARGLAAEALDMLAGPRREAAPQVLIVCGPGNNGGDGYALGRHLHNAGIDPVFWPLGEPAAGTDAAINRGICRRIGLQEIEAGRREAFRGADLIVDAIFGTGLDRPVSGLPAEAIRWINGTRRPVLAVDVPSGLDCDTGRPLGEAVRACCTVTFVARKPGFLAAEAAACVGRVVVADIGAPIELLARFGRPRPEAAG